MLLTDYKDNEVSADIDYKGSFIEVAGVVGEIKKDILGKPYVTVGHGRDLEIPVVQCVLRPAEVDRATSLHKGDSVTVRGTVTGLLFNVQMTDCEIR